MGPRPPLVSPRQSQNLTHWSGLATRASPAPANRRLNRFHGQKNDPSVRTPAAVSSHAAGRRSGDFGCHLALPSAVSSRNLTITTSHFRSTPTGSPNGTHL